MTRDIKDIITDMREIVKPCIAQMLFNENFEGKGNTDKAEFETEFEMLLTLAERGATVEAVPLSVIEDIKYDVEKYFVDNIWAKKDDCSEETKHFKAVLEIIDKAVKECTHE